MRSIFSALLLLAGGLFSAQPGRSQAPPVLSGIVVDQLGHSLTFVPVEVRLGDSLLTTCFTDDEGRYLISGLDEGTYQLRVPSEERPGMGMASVVNGCCVQAPVIKAHLSVPRVAIGGCYIDRDLQRGVEGARVVARNTAGTRVETVTDAGGNFLFRSLPPGKDTLVFHDRGTFQVVSDIPAVFGLDSYRYPSSGPLLFLQVGSRHWYSIRWYQLHEWSWSSSRIDGDRLDAMPVFNLNDQLSTLPGFYQQRAGGPLSVEGGRTDGNLYLVDGIQLR